MIRTTAIYGPHDNFNPEKGHVIPDLIHKASIKLNPFEIWGDGKQVRDFIYVDDVVDGLMAVIEKYPTGDPINIATGTPTTVVDLVKTITNAFGYEPIHKFDTSKPTMIPIRQVSVEKAKTILNWKAKTNLKDGIEKTVEWYKLNK